MRRPEEDFSKREQRRLWWLRYRSTVAKISRGVLLREVPREKMV